MAGPIVPTRVTFTTAEGRRRRVTPDTIVRRADGGLLLTLTTPTAEGATMEVIVLAAVDVVAIQQPHPTDYLRYGDAADWRPRAIADLPEAVA